MTAPKRTPAVLALRVAVTAVVLLFVGRALARQWHAVGRADVTVTLHPGWILAAAAGTLLTYAVQVESWRRVLAGWAQRISFVRAAEAWCLANLGRYVPGKVWSIAGLVVLGQRHGVAVEASAASAVAVQALGMGTCVAAIVLTIPGRFPPLALAGAAAGAVAVLAALGTPGATALVGRLTRGRLGLRPLPAGAIAAASLLTFASWLAYGAVFWMLARGVGHHAGLSLPVAVGTFATGYLVGLLALLAPGGIGAREAAFLALLTPLIGAGGAIALSVASRLLLTLTELGAAALAWTLARRDLQRGRTA